MNTFSGFLKSITADQDMPTSVQNSNSEMGLWKMVSKSWKECLKSLKSYTQTEFGTIK